ncbi:hypothetical protein HDU83_008781 [Entophlyctis luteolus]|nr:hypothetical protein HDU83_008781 [Entophlyctis luteolus]
MNTDTADWQSNSSADAEASTSRSKHVAYIAPGFDEDTNENDRLPPDQTSSADASFRLDPTDCSFPDPSSQWDRNTYKSVSPRSADSALMPFGEEREQQHSDNTRCSSSPDRYSDVFPVLSSNNRTAEVDPVSSTLSFSKLATELNSHTTADPHDQLWHVCQPTSTAPSVVLPADEWGTQNTLPLDEIPDVQMIMHHKPIRQHEQLWHICQPTSTAPSVVLPTDEWGAQNTQPLDEIPDAPMVMHHKSVSQQSWKESGRTNSRNNSLSWNYKSLGAQPYKHQFVRGQLSSSANSKVSHHAPKNQKSGKGGKKSTIESLYKPPFWENGGWNDSQKGKSHTYSVRSFPTAIGIAAEEEWGHSLQEDSHNQTFIPSSLIETRTEAQPTIFPQTTIPAVTLPDCGEWDFAPEDNLDLNTDSGAGFMPDFAGCPRTSDALMESAKATSVESEGFMDRGRLLQNNVGDGYAPVGKVANSTMQGQTERNRKGFKQNREIFRSVGFAVSKFDERSSWKSNNSAGKGKKKKDFMHIEPFFEEDFGDHDAPIKKPTIQGYKQGLEWRCGYTDDQGIFHPGGYVQRANSINANLDSEPFVSLDVQNHPWERPDSVQDSEDSAVEDVQTARHIELTNANSSSTAPLVPVVSAATEELPLSFPSSVGDWEVLFVEKHQEVNDPRYSNELIQQEEFHTAKDSLCKQMKLKEAETSLAVPAQTSSGDELSLQFAMIGISSEPFQALSTSSSAARTSYAIPIVDPKGTVILPPTLNSVDPICGFASETSHSSNISEDSVKKSGGIDFKTVLSSKSEVPEFFPSSIWQDRLDACSRSEQEVQRVEQQEIFNRFKYIPEFIPLSKNENEAKNGIIMGQDEAYAGYAEVDRTKRLKEIVGSFREFVPQVGYESNHDVEYFQSEDGHYLHVLAGGEVDTKNDFLPEDDMIDIDSFWEQDSVSFNAGLSFPQAVIRSFEVDTVDIDVHEIQSRSRDCSNVMLELPRAVHESGEIYSRPKCIVNFEPEKIRVFVPPRVPVGVLLVADTNESFCNS